MRTHSTCFRFAFAAALAFFCVGSSSEAAQIVVTCVGDSITAGYGLSNPGTQSYPAQLQTLLGSGYTVINDGASGSTVLKVSDNSFWSSSYSSWAYTNSMNSNPNIVVMMFGANDSKSWNWNAANFNSDYRALIAQYTNLPTHPKVFVCYTTPMFMPTAFGTTFDPVFIENTVEPAIGIISTQAGLQLIDNDMILIDRPDLFQDGVHPTVTGAGIVAQRVANALLGLTPTNLTTAAITSSGTPSVYGAPVTYTVTLTSSAGTVTGAVIFAANNVPFSTNTLSGGTASVTNSLLPIGANVVAAQYVSQGKYLGSTHSLYQTVLDPAAPTLTDLGGSTPVHGPNDIFQLSTSGDTTWPDGINYFSNNNPDVGQTFTTGANALNLVSVAIKTAGLNNGGGYGSPSSTPTYYLRIYSMSGSTATLVNTFSATNPGFTDGDWLKWSGLNVPLATNKTYAYSFGIPGGGGWAALAVAGNNTYAGGEIAVIPTSGGTITSGGSHSFDATFVLGLVSNTPPVLAAITNRTVNVGQTVAFTASATDTDSPAQTLTFALLSGATNATLNTNSGAFSFRPLVTQANSTNNFTLKVSDNGSPVLSTTQNFFIVVNPLTSAGIGNVSVVGKQLSFQISGQSGPDYTVETSTNLSQWSTILTTNSPQLPFTWIDTNSAAASQRFYRVKLGPLSHSRKTAGAFAFAGRRQVHTHCQRRRCEIC
jgi:lysophospholipase L1-like esterase